MASHEQSQAEAVEFVSIVTNFTIRWKRWKFQDFLPTVTAQLSEVEVGVENDPSASAVLLQSIVR